MIRMNLKWLVPFAALAALAGCDPEVIIYEKEPAERDLGLPCVLDSECSTGRCMAGVCSVNECETDEDCREDEICNPITHTCEPISNYACGPGQSPILQLEITAVDFGTVTVGESSVDSVTLNNIGDCLLTVEQAQLDNLSSDPAFSCDNCGADQYPKAIPPGHYVTVNLSFTPPAEQTYAGNLLVRTDDPSLSDGLATIGLSGEGLGHARMSIDPVLVDFGNVLPNDPAVTQVITVTNVGAGTLELSRAFIDPPLTSGMTVSPEVGPLDSPLELIANQTQEFTVTYDPTGLSAANAVLYLFSNDLTRTCASDSTSTAGVGCVEFSGDSRGPPAIQVSHASIDFGQMNLGQSAAEMVTISNNGQSDLDIQVSMTVLSSTDFRYTPPRPR